MPRKIIQKKGKCEQCGREDREDGLTKWHGKWICRECLIDENYTGTPIPSLQSSMGDIDSGASLGPIVSRADKKNIAKAVRKLEKWKSKNGWGFGSGIKFGKGKGN